MIPQEIRRALLEPARVSSVVALRPGFSGASLYRCESEPSLVLKCWPKGTSIDRVDQIHSVIRSLSQACRLIPRYRFIGNSDQTYYLDSSKRIWELASWMPGQPLPYDATLDAIVTGAATLGVVHEHLRTFGVRQAMVPAVAERIERINQLSEVLPACWHTTLQGRVHPSVITEVADANRLLRGRWCAISAQLSTALHHLNQPSNWAQYVIRDVHRDHMLFQDGQPSGIIDFDALRVDTPATDVARWVTSFSQYAQNPAQTLDAVVAGYFGGSTLTKQDASGQDPPETLGQAPNIGVTAVAAASQFRTLLEELARSSLWISLANWVVWLVDERKDFPDYRMVQQRLRQILASLQVA